MDNDTEMEFEYTATSLLDYMAYVLSVAKPFLGRLPIGYKLLYRGQAEKQWELLPAIARGKKASLITSIFDYERNLIEEAKYRLPNVFSESLLPVDLLALLQHYGIPTRLLDVTASPLVALFFACCSSFDKDAEVIVFKKCIEDNATYPVQNAIADTYRLARRGSSALSSFYDRMLCQPYTAEQVTTLKMVNRTSEVGAEWIEECCKETVFVQAKVFAERQKIQQGEFILFPNNIRENGDGSKSFENGVSPIEKKNDKVYRRIIIPSAIKAEILQELNALGINGGSLFADSIEKVCKQINLDIGRMV